MLQGPDGDLRGGDLPCSHKYDGQVYTGVGPDRISVKWTYRLQGKLLVVRPLMPLPPTSWWPGHQEVGGFPYDFAKNIQKQSSMAIVLDELWI